MSNAVSKMLSIQQEIPLSKTTKFVVDNRGRTAPTEKTGIPLIATNCISNRNLYPVHENLRYVSRETYDNWFRSHPEPGDLLFTLKGSQNGAVCLAPNPVNFVIAQDMVALRVDEKVIDPLFLFAALRSDEVQAQIKNLDVSGVIPHLKKSDFDKLILPYPERYIQQSIGQFYFYTSKKIDLLHRQNKTLEAMAETLFRQWFVEEAGEDWEVKRLGELVNVIDNRGKTPPYFDIPTPYPIIEVNALTGKNRLVDYSAIRKYVSDDTFKTWFRGHPKKFDSLISTVGSIGEIAMFLIEEGCIAQNVVALSAINISPIYLFEFLKHSKEEIQELDIGSVQPSIKVPHLLSIRIAIPPVKKLELFDIEVKKILEKMILNQKQIRTLETLRDTLLPKLMSGEVRVDYP